MARKPQPWFREERRAWYVMIRGQQQYLGEHPKGAPKPRKRNGQWNAPKPIRDEFHRLMALPEPTPEPEPTDAVDSVDSLTSLFHEFLRWVKVHREPLTLEWYRQRLCDFDEFVGDLDPQALTIRHVERWIETKRSDSHRRGCVTAVQRALNWAVKRKLVSENPLHGMEKPAAGKREVVLSEDEYQAILARASDAPFRNLLTFIWETGARPQEATALERRHLELVHSRAVFPEKESKGKKKKRVIHFNATAQALVERLAEELPTGPLFRNAKGEPWSRNQIACRFERIMVAVGKERLKAEGQRPTEKEVQKVLVSVPFSKRVRDKTTGTVTEVPRSEKERLRDARERVWRRMAKRRAEKYCLYNFRHTWMTRMLKAGVDPITVATLAGHNDVSMLARIYQHIGQDTEHLQKALAKLTTFSSPTTNADG